MREAPEVADNTKACIQWSFKVDNNGALTDTFQNNPQFGIRLSACPRTTGPDFSVIIALLQKYRREEGLDILRIGFLVYKLPDNEMKRQDESFFRRNKPVARSHDNMCFREVRLSSTIISHKSYVTFRLLFGFIYHLVIISSFHQRFYPMKRRSFYSEFIAPAILKDESSNELNPTFFPSHLHGLFVIRTKLLSEFLKYLICF